MFCSNCGFENEERANFCYKCGRPLRKISPNQPVQQFPPQQGPFLNTPDFKTPKKNKKNFLPLIIAIALIVVAAIIAGILFLFPKKTPILDNIVDAIFCLYISEPCSNAMKMFL